MHARRAHEDGVPQGQPLGEQPPEDSVVALEETIESVDELDSCVVCEKQKAAIGWTCLDCHGCRDWCWK